MGNYKLHFVMLMLSGLFLPCCASADDFKCVNDITIPDTKVQGTAALDGVYKTLSLVNRRKEGSSYTTAGYDFFILDEGASNTVFGGKLATDLGIDLSNCKVAGYTETANGRTPFCEFKVDTFEFSSIKCSNITVIVLPNSPSLIGNDILSKLDVSTKGGLKFFSVP